MRILVAYIYLVFSLLGFSQNQFVFTEDGLTPEAVDVQLGGISLDTLQQRALDWIHKTLPKDTVLSTKIYDNNIEFTVKTYDVITAEKKSYHFNYTIKISFKDGVYTFKPLSLQTKMNSKYDMGWTDFNLKDGSLFFKRGKMIKKLKSYVYNIPKTFNLLNNNLYEYLHSKNK